MSCHSLTVASLQTVYQVQHLEKRFKKLDSDASIALLKRVVEVFDADLNGEVDFKEFVMGLAQFRFEFSH